MAARHNPQHQEPTKRRIQASQLLNRLYSFANGKCTMRPEQVMAAKIVIAKAIPDLKTIEHRGSDEAPVLKSIIVEFVSANEDQSRPALHSHAATDSHEVTKSLRS